ncbi:hypothetical protein ACFSQ3_09605 [Sphingobacterium corticis]|uniref:YopX protein domain-containing protein n=1 Tax=Sphingobacterium corticis TaxID=1812823 RepID=A0ABW5NLS5_9SPHI
MIELKDCTPGFILKATENGRDEGYHPIVYIGGHSDADFLGAMITTSPYNGQNIKMEKAHFKDGFDLCYKNSFLVKGRFIKPNKWGPFTKVGELTAEGLKFVVDQIQDCQNETFDEYFERGRA